MTLTCCLRWGTALLTALMIVAPIGNLASSDPVEAKTPSPKTKRIMILTWRLPDDIRANTNGAEFFTRIPTDIPKLEGGSTNSQAVIVQFRDESGTVVGVESEMIMPHPGNAALKPGEEYEVGHTLLFPGRGTLYAWCVETFPPEMSRVRALAQTTGKPWTGIVEARTTRGPRADGKCDINYGTGEFDGTHGTFLKTHIIRSVDLSTYSQGYHGETRYVIELEK
jgi:hypothetical protein